MITGSNASGYMMPVPTRSTSTATRSFGNNGDPFDGITVSVSPATATPFFPPSKGNILAETLADLAKGPAER
jgi:hypothetical protein